MRYPFTVYLDDEIPAEQAVVNYIHSSPLRRQDLLRNMMIRAVGGQPAALAFPLPTMEGVVDLAKAKPAASLSAEPKRTPEASAEPASGRYSNVFEDK